MNGLDGRAAAAHGSGPVGALPVARGEGEGGGPRMRRTEAAADVV